MRFLNAKTPGELRAAVESRHYHVAHSDQLRAEEDEAERLVPLSQNRRLANHPEIRLLVRQALTSERDWESAHIPVLLYTFYGPAADLRDRDEPIRSDLALRFCHLCHESRSSSIPFWLNALTAIVQIDLCDACSMHAMDELGATPQLGISV